ncbi:DoxX family protein [Elizabethkingia anophelis]|uniref:DoxX family protein n=1 Tax=Elizabethkingia anophelis TaxID=1117645 RepID=UPI000D0312EA|nr:MauE/DoxX family redox-associated membrane protein [Elizabethkingia anophelis]MCL1689432.1 YIP1 family protein [Elizabethkingia anophelis]MDV4009436.1 tellurium resistance protein TerC [Elizabethkingia anophelis]MYY46374.1 YIP1 family protein [Elizabethkingia anophelis]PRQ84116.1 tellurium resistance protein TerC [Elizabethkingia anophelis]PRQ85016.1 tellurium resistance protein TerC [Elizabethkingia anophelis]
MKTNRTKTIFVQFTVYLFILLFIYAAFSKLMDFEAFQVQLAQSPLLSAYAGIISYAVIIVELIIVGLLYLSKTRLIGLYASFGLMISFTVYIYLILNFSDFVPCSCGGILEKLGWTEHLIFNIFCIMLAYIALFIIEKKHNTRTKKFLLLPVIIGILSSGLVVYLFVTSEHIIKKENNFTRRFPHHPIIKDQILDLGVNSYYFAGCSNDSIYLGNYTSPLTLTSLGYNLTHKQETRIIPDETRGITFKSLLLRINAPYFYLSDGTVPIIYRGILGSKNAEIVSKNDVYFTQLEPVDSLQFVFRAKSSQTKSNVLGTLNLSENQKVNLNHDILGKSKEGIFDSDGKLISDPKGKRISYVSFYINQFISADPSLNNLKRLHTIDTITRPQIETVLLENGSRKMNKPPLIVNKNMALHRDLLFNESNLMGKHESQKQWRQAAIVDVYRTDQQQYIGSFYVHHRGKNKMSDMLVTDKYFYTLIGNEIVRYSLAQSITDHFKKGKAENLTE